MVATSSLAKAKLDLREPVADGEQFTPGASIRTIDFSFNPKDYRMSMQAGWNFKPQKGDVEPPEFTGNQPRSLDVELFLDGTEVGSRPVQDSLDALLVAVKPTDRTRDSGTPFPPLVVFSWGTTTPFVGVIKSVQATLTMFKPNGEPLRATCRISMQEYSVGVAGQNPTSGAERSSRLHRVVLGDTLASIANAELGSPTLWRSIAEINGIEDPFSLRIGSELLIPAPADAMELA